MQYTELGRTGMRVSRLCLGTMTFGWSADEPTSFAIMDAAVDAGINFFDTADVYSRWVPGNQGGESETIIGKWLGGKPREQVILATKVRGRVAEDGEGLNRGHILRAVERSLRRLGTDYIDLYQAHWPDESTLIEETLSAFDSLVKSGKVRFIGASNYNAQQLRAALDASRQHGYARYDCLQPHYSLLHRSEFEESLDELCADEGIGVIPYSPLAAGFLTGKYNRETYEADTTRRDSGLIQQLLQDDRAWLALGEARNIAAGYNVPVSHVALAWLLDNPVVSSPIIGARTVDQLSELVGATELRLSPQEVNRLSEVSVGF